MESNIELRSQKVRNIIGKIPPIIDRIGISVISFVIFMTLLGAYFLPYPEYIKMPIEVNKEPLMEVVKSPEFGFFNITSSVPDVDKGDLVGYIQTDKDSLLNLYAPFRGKIFFNAKSIHEVRSGEILYGIVQDSLQKVYGIGYIPLKLRNRLSVGLTLEFNSNEISLEGVVSKIDELPTDDSLYRVEVVFQNNLSDEVLDALYYLPKIEGEGNILVSKKSLLRRIMDIK